MVGRRARSQVPTLLTVEARRTEDSVSITGVHVSITSNLTLWLFSFQTFFFLFLKGDCL